MKQMLLLLTLFVCVISQQIEKSKFKGQQLRRESEKSDHGLIEFNQTGINYFINQNPRDYDVVVFFTTDNCDLCHEIQKEYQIVAEMYKNNGGQYHRKEGSKKQRAVFFGVISYNHQNHQAFLDHQFNSVPNIVYYPAKIMNLNKEQKQIALKDFLWQISQNDGHITSVKILEFLNSKSGRNIQYKESLLRLLMVLFILGMVIYQLVLIFNKFVKFFSSPKLWFVGSIIIYIICMAGVVHNIIHQTPFTQVTKKGEVQWYADGGRNQLGMEGLVMSASITLAGLFLLFAVEGSRNIHHNSNKFYSILLRHSQYFFFLLFFVASSHLLKFIDQMYQIKSHYTPTFFPPEHFIKGPLINDQGNSF